MIDLPFQRWLTLLMACSFLAGCEEVDSLRQRDVQQQQAIDKLREENAEFQAAYYKIKETLDSEATHNRQEGDRLQRDLDEARNLKSQQEKKLTDELRTTKLELAAARKDAAEQKTAADAQINTLTQQNQRLDAESKAASAKVAELDAGLIAEKQHGAGLSTQVGTLTVEVQTLKDQHKNLEQTLEQRDKALKDAQAETKTRSDELEALNKKLATLQNDLSAQKESSTRLEQALAQAKNGPSTETLAAAHSENTKLKSQIEELKAQVKSAAAANAEHSSDDSQPLDKDPALIDATTKLIALLNKTEGTEGVEVKLDQRGLRVMLPSDTLFEKGGIDLSEKGTAILKPVAEQAAALEGRAVRVEGHTDNQPIGDLPFADNWGLGYARADRVRAWLMEHGKLGGKRITALSRGQFDPLKENDTPAGRTRNRRVEIVIGAKI